MSMYGEDGSTGYAKEELHNEIEAFLGNHSLSELFEILARVISYKEYKESKG